MKNKTKILLLLIIPLILIGCLKDKITPPIFVSLNDNAKLLFYLEDEGDYYNSAEMPSLVDVDDVFANITGYLLIDIRTPEQFSSGHIDGAINKNHTHLISFLDSTDTSLYSKIVIISENGQSSAFYTCLLRLYGFRNAFSMSYGMAAWNNYFSDTWLGSLQQDDESVGQYTDATYNKPPYGSLPSLTLTGSNLSQGVKQRIAEIMNIEFEDSIGNQESTATIEYLSMIGNPENFYKICYGQNIFYKDIRTGIFHPVGTVLYYPPPSSSDFSSSRNLQTIPANQKIAIYSTDGQLSAFAVAYLRVLGYDAKSILFGANNMFYNILLAAPGLNNEAFSQATIRNYPYVTGN
jgi:rhodanese-related sulfurtransferase